MRLPRFIQQLWRRLQALRRRPRVVRVRSMADLPEKLGQLLYVVGDPHPKWVVLSCPCGCGERIDVNLMTSRHPYWKLSETRNGLSLWPSLWIPEDRCGSHFWIKDSRVHWAGQEPIQNL